MGILNVDFFNQFECRRKLTLYSRSNITITQAIQDLNLAIASYALSDRNNPTKLKNLIDCRDWLKVVQPTEQDVEQWLTTTKILAVS